MAMSVVYETFCGQIVSENRGGVERDYGCDTLGSTAALYDSAGTKTDEWTYWPYGEIRTHTGSSTTPFTFVGTLGYYMDQTAQFYVRARYLMTSLARWLTVDPLWPREKAFGYVDGRPLIATDWRGLSPCDDFYALCMATVAAAAAAAALVAGGILAWACAAACATFLGCVPCLIGLGVIASVILQATLIGLAACLLQKLVCDKSKTHCASNQKPPPTEGKPISGSTPTPSNSGSGGSDLGHYGGEWSGRPWPAN